MSTTAFINRQEYRDHAGCHGGVGPFRALDFVLPAGEKQFIKFIHDDIIPPGSTFGYHQHASDQPMEEWYICLSGRGVMTLDGIDHAMAPGDSCVCRANGSHGLRNTGDEAMRIIVVFASPIQAGVSV